MFTKKFTKFAAVLTMSAGLLGASASTSRAGDLSPLFGALIGGGLGAGVGYAGGKDTGAMIGGLAGAGLGAVMATVLDKHNGKRDRGYDYPAGYYPAGYSAPVDGVVPPPVYVPPPSPNAWDPTAAYTPPTVYYPVSPTTLVPASPTGYIEWCQDYYERIRINGRRHYVPGAVCKQPDGSWHRVR